MKRALNTVARRFGWELIRYGVRPFVGPKQIAGYSYSPVLPTASYSPWMDDEAFQAIYRRVQGNTLVDVYRCYELWTLAMQVYALRGDMIEIGVWRGGSGAVLAAANLKMGGKRIVYLADTFRGVVKASGKDASYVGGEHSDTSRQLVEDLLKTNSLSNVELLVLGIIVG